MDILQPESSLNAEVYGGTDRFFDIFLIKHADNCLDTGFMPFSPS